MTTYNSYSDEQRDEAVSYAAEHGLATAARELLIPKTTISTWAAERNVDVADEVMRQQVERATTMSVANRRQKVAETKERLTILLAVIAELGARAQIDLLRAGKLTMVEAVGATTRAIHDLQLLEGKPTEITEEVTAEELIKLRDELQELVDSEEGTEPYDDGITQAE